MLNFRDIDAGKHIGFLSLSSFGYDYKMCVPKSVSVLQ